eukprot:UN14273
MTAQPLVNLGLVLLDEGEVCSHSQLPEKQWSYKNWLNEMGSVILTGVFRIDEP